MTSARGRGGAYFPAFAVPCFPVRVSASHGGGIFCPLPDSLQGPAGSRFTLKNVKNYNFFLFILSQFFNNNKFKI